MWLLSLQPEVAHLKQTAVDIALLQERVRVESQGRWATPVPAGAESAAQSLFTYPMMAPQSCRETRQDWSRRGHGDIGRV